MWLVLGACTSVSTLAELGPKTLRMQLDNDGLISSPPRYGVYAVLEWGQSGAIGGCAGLDGLTLSFAENDIAAYDLGGSRGTACSTQAAVTDVVEVPAWLDSPSEKLTLADASATLSVTVAYPVAMRTVEPTVAEATPGETVRFEWWPATDILPAELDVVVGVVGAASADTVTSTVAVVDGGFDVSVPYTAADGVLRVAVATDHADFSVTDSVGLESVEVSGLLFHPPEGTVNVGPLPD